MIRALVLVIALAPAVSRAQEAGSAAGSAGSASTDAELAAEAALDQARYYHGRGDFAAARDQLLQAYAFVPRPELLFALGQVELNLGHYQAAIGYYEKFIATNPAEDQAALAQQAIGAARLQLDRPPPPPPRPAPPKLYAHRWDALDSTFAALGGVAVLAGGALLYDAHALDDDHSGTLSTYDERFSRAQTRRLEGIIGISAGVALAAAALVRWRVSEVEVHVDVRGDGGALRVGRTW